MAKHFLVTLLALFLAAQGVFSADQKFLKVYTWYSYVPPEIVKKFEEKTGIKVILDLYDTNEILEAKLLTGSVGYDLVFPSLWPYMARQIPANLYQPIQKNKLKNYKRLDPQILKRCTSADPQNTYGIPYLWGVVGLGVNVEEVRKRLPNVSLDSWGLIYDPHTASKLSSCGIALAEEPAEVLIPAMLYLGLDPLSQDPADLKKVEEHFKTLRKSITRYDSSRAVDDLSVGNLCVVQNWPGSIEHAIDRIALQNRSPFKVFIPKEGTLMWIDMIGIPATAENVDEAHAFIDFLLEPETMAALSNHTYFPNPIPDSYPFIQKRLRTDKALFPDKDVLRKALLNETKSLQHQKRMIRTLTKIRTGR